MTPDLWLDADPLPTPSTTPGPARPTDRDAEWWRAQSKAKLLEEDGVERSRRLRRPEKVA